jgi:hypothetical protein
VEESLEKFNTGLVKFASVAANQDAAIVDTSRLRHSLIKRFIAVLGPGLISGAVDDDPSGIATYSIAGAHIIRD